MHALILALRGLTVSYIPQNKLANPKIRTVIALPIATIPAVIPPIADRPRPTPKIILILQPSLRLASVTFLPKRKVQIIAQHADPIGWLCAGGWGRMGLGLAAKLVFRVDAAGFRVFCWGLVIGHSLVIVSIFYQLTNFQFNLFYYNCDLSCTQSQIQTLTIIMQTMLSKHLKLEQAFPQSSKPEFTQFKAQLQAKFTGCKLYKPSASQPSETIFETALLFAVADYKHELIKRGNEKAQQDFLAPIKKNKAQILQKSKSSDQEFQAYCSTLAKFVHFLDNAQILVGRYEQLLYHTVLTLCNKEQNTFLWMRNAVEYTYKDIGDFGGLFGEVVYCMDFQDQRKITKDFQNGAVEAIYLLKMKDRYYFLSAQASQPVQSQPQIQSQIRSQQPAQSAQQIPTASKIMTKGTMKILQSGTLPASSVEQIFTKKHLNSKFNPNLNSREDDLRSSQNSTQDLLRQSQSRNNAGLSINQTLLNQPQQPSPSPLKTQPNQTSSIRNSQVVQTVHTSRSLSEDSILLITQVKCGKCEKNFSEIDCLDWNYMYYCHSCLIDINVDTSDIPAPRVNKFLRERNIAAWSYELQCPQCMSVTSIPRYNPSNKNKHYQCTQCRKTICIKHHGNIYQCYCYCPKCKTPTINVQPLHTNICQNCRASYCFKCKKKGHNLCKCICKQCLGQESKEHECQPACHSCNNRPTKLRICRCGLFICYGCYYLVLGGVREGGGFSCVEGEYA